jgi:transposase
MSLKLESIPSVPQATQRVAQAAFPKGCLCMSIRDQIGLIYQDEQFQMLFSRRGQPAENPCRLVLICILQFIENLSDRQAANAVCGRIDWKYLLSLELEDSGFDASVLTEFRARLLKGGLEQELLDAFLARFREEGLLKARGKQRSDSSHVLAAIRALNRLECVGESLRHALNVLALVAPDWLLKHSNPEWLERYATRVDNYRLPDGEVARIAYAEQIGRDGQSLLTAIELEENAGWLAEVPAIRLLRQVWEQNFIWKTAELAWHSSEEIPPSRDYIGSPYDPEAHYCKKRNTAWVGYKVHLTETCDESEPRLITHVETSLAKITDDAVVEGIHQSLEQKGLLPQTHLVDGGYTTAPVLALS